MLPAKNSPLQTFGIFSVTKEPGFKEGSHFKRKKLSKPIKILVMKTQLSNTSLSVEVKETMSALCTPARSKIISVADVWNIQRSKRSRVQRRFAL